jgi:hypothetical protein
MLGQVGPQYVDDKRRRLMGGEHRDLSPLAHRHQRVWRDLAVRQHQHRRLQRHDTGDAPLAIVRGGAAQVRNFAFAQNLDAVGMDVIEVADQIRTGACGTHRDFVKSPFRGPETRHPFPFQKAAKLFKEDIGTDNVGLHGGG